MPFVIPECTDVFVAIGIGNGEVSVEFAIPEFTYVFVASLGKNIGAKEIQPGRVRFVSLNRARRQSKTLPRTSKQHGKGQADGGGQVSHTGILTENVWDG